MKKQDVAKEVGVVPGTISEWFRREDFLREYEKVMRAHIQEMSARAVDRINQLIYAESESVSLQAAKDIASRANYDAPAKQEIKAEGIAIKVDYNDKEE